MVSDSFNGFVAFGGSVDNSIVENRIKHSEMYDLFAYDPPANTWLNNVYKTKNW
jgi:hypothetical protein